MLRAALRLRAACILFGAVAAPVTPAAAQALLVCDRARNETLFFSGGQIEYELILSGTRVLDTGIAGPKVVLLCDTVDGERRASFTCPGDAAKVQVWLSRNGRVSAKCVRHSAPVVRSEGTGTSTDPGTETGEDTNEEGSGNGSTN